MEFRLNEEQQAFADDVREFIQAHLPEDIARKVSRHQHLSRDDYMRWQQILGRKGWHTFNWPEEYGGPGWNVIQSYLFEVISAEMDCPIIQPFGPRMAGPVIYTFGTQEQKERFLPGIRDSTVWWCQGYSEPQAGSDLASLSTQAEDRGDHYLVNGQKIWTSYAHYADWMFCLVRTHGDGRPQEGISFLLIDMKSPGVEVQPILMLEGTHSFNTVFLENVKVPKENLIGEQDRGWSYAKFLLEHERVDNAAIGVTKAAMRRLKSIAGQEQIDGQSLLDDPLFHARVASVEAQLQALEVTSLRVLSQVASGQAPGPVASLLKIRGTEIAQRISELTSEAVGPYAIPFQPEYLRDETSEDPVGPSYAATAANNYIWRRCMSIYGGSNEIQRNIIAKHMLEL